MDISNWNRSQIFVRISSRSTAMKLLVIDDEPLTLEFLSQALRDQGYLVDTSTDGEDGLYKEF